MASLVAVSAAGTAPVRLRIVESSEVMALLAESLRGDAAAAERMLDDRAATAESR